MYEMIKFFKQDNSIENYEAVKLIILRIAVNGNRTIMEIEQLCKSAYIFVIRERCLKYGS